jgi:hypothetical protein
LGSWAAGPLGGEVDVLDGPAKFGGRWHPVARGIISSGAFGISPFGVVCVQWFDYASVGSDQVDAAVSVASALQLLTMFASVMGSA